MKTIYHAANSRGYADHGWLKSYHTFSFAGYYNPDRVNFGALRVLNDDYVEGGRGFGTHPHNNMEIISIPLEGDLEHRDSMGSGGIIQKGDVQVMSAGTGITHSEFNANADRPVKFLQIWVFPRENGLTPRYDQMRIDDFAKPNDFQLIVSPYPGSEGMWINQDSWFYLANFKSGFAKEYQLNKEGNGVYIFVIHGKARVGTQELNTRDGFGIREAKSFRLEATEDAEILLMEVPVNA